MCLFRITLSATGVLSAPSARRRTSRTSENEPSPISSITSNAAIETFSLGATVEAVEAVASPPSSPAIAGVTRTGTTKGQRVTHPSRPVSRPPSEDRRADPRAYPSRSSSPRRADSVAERPGGPGASARARRVPKVSSFLRSRKSRCYHRCSIAVSQYSRRVRCWGPERDARGAVRSAGSAR